MTEPAAPGGFALPRSVRLAAWGGAVLRGEVAPDAALAAVTDDELHRAVGLPDQAEPVGLALLLGHWRAAGVRGLRLVLPAPGDVGGLPGPPDLNAAAVAVGEAVLTVGPTSEAAVPVVTPLGSSGTQVRWELRPARPRPLGGPGLAEAERELSGTLRESTELLAALDVARPDATAGPALERLRSGAAAEGALPPGYPARAYRVMTTAVRIGAIASLAAAGPGGAVTAGEARARAQALVPMARASRRAVEAAVNAPLEAQAATGVPGHDELRLPADRSPGWRGER